MTYNSTVYDAFAAKSCLNPIRLETNPFAKSNGTAPHPPLGPDAVCGVKYAGGGRRDYRLVSYESIEAAEADGSFVTHGTQCGACSTLHDLGMFMKYPDLTFAVQQCSWNNFAIIDQVTECIREAVGLSLPCAEMFSWDSFNSLFKCMDICVLDMLEGTPNNLPPDNRLNDCLQCDEDHSGAVFRYYAGRSRPSSGLNCSVIRPQVFRIIHDYY
eukprot:gene5715-8727_t